MYKMTNSINPKFDSIEQVYDKIIKSLQMVIQLKPGHPHIQRFIGEISVLLKTDNVTPESFINTLNDLVDRYPSYRKISSKYDEDMIIIAVKALASYYTTYESERRIIEKISQKKKSLNRPLTDEERSKIFEECASKEIPWSTYTDDQKLMILNSEKYR